MEWNGMGWNGVEWEWNGIEWNGMDSPTFCSLLHQMGRKSSLKDNGQDLVTFNKLGTLFDIR